MDTISSVPPPYRPTGSIPPFTTSSVPPICCRLTGMPVSKQDALFISMDGGMSFVAVKPDALCEALNLDTEEDRRSFIGGFFGSDRDKPRVLLWNKLSRHRPTLFRLLLETLKS